MLLADAIEFTKRNYCPLCNSSEFKLHIDFPDIPVNRCLKCGFMYSSRLMSEDCLKMYYKEGFGSLRHQLGQRVNAKINTWVLSHLLPLPKKRRLLDIGTGYGFFLSDMANEFKLDVTGVELSSQEAVFGREVLHINVVNALLSESGLKKNFFDIATAFEVVEHIPDPRGFILELREYIKSDGFLFIMTDNFASSIVSSMGAGFPKWIPHSHVSHFGAEQFESTIQSSGFEVLKRFSYTPWELLLSNLHQKLKGVIKTPAEAFNLADTFQSEMHGTYKLFRIRLLINRLWARLQGHSDLTGAIMYVLARKK